MKGRPRGPARRASGGDGDGAGASSSPLPPERVPFPVEPQYRIRADLRRLETGGVGPGREAAGQRAAAYAAGGDAEQGHFVLDRQWPRYLTEKLELLRSAPQQCRVLAPGADEAGLERSLWQVAEAVAAEHPEQLAVDGQGLRLPRLGLRLGRDGELAPLPGAARPSGARPAGPNGAETADGPLGVGDLAERCRLHLAGLDGLPRLADALALCLQEDLVLMSRPAGESRAELLHVCFPSRWSPRERAGLGFAAIHEPVPHSEALRAASRNVMAALLERGPFVRYVWSLTADPSLDQNPSRREPPAAPTGDPLEWLHLRVERQTTLPLERHALFTIRIFVTPLRPLLDPRRAALLAGAVRSMSEPLLRYKGLTEVRAALLSALDRLAGG